MTSLFAAVAGPTAAAPGGMTASFEFPPDFAGFAGHFPDNPVLPGIAQVMAVLHAMEPETPPSLRGIKTCKFLRPVRPGERLTLTFQPGGGVADRSVAATLRVGDEVCASMTLLLGEPDIQGGG